MSEPDLDLLYKRASGEDGARPSSKVRREVLAYATRLANARSQTTSDDATTVSAPDPRPSADAHKLRKPAPKGALERFTRLTRLSRWRLQLVAPLVAAALAAIILQPLLRSMAPASLQHAQTQSPAQTSTLSQSDARLVAKTQPPQAPPAASERISAGAPAPASPVGSPAASLPASGAAAPAAASPSVASSARQIAPQPFPAAPAAVAPSSSSTSNTVSAESAGRAADSARQADLGSLNEIPTARAPVRAAERSAGAEARPSQSLPGAPGGTVVALEQAAASGDAQRVRSLLRTNALSINARDARGRTALMLATLSGRTNAVAVLLAQGADPNTADSEGRTPLHVAQQNNQAAIVAALLRAGAR